MAIYIIVDKDKDPLESNEINAGDEIEVSDGDTYVIDPSANSDIKFEADDDPASFEVVFLDSNDNGFDIKVSSDLTASFIVDDDVDASSIKLDAKAADGFNLNAGDNFSFGQLEAATKGPNSIEIGDGFNARGNWKLGETDDSLIVGNSATFQTIDAGKGNDTITIGDDATISQMDTKEGDDEVTIGDGLMSKSIKTSDGDDTVRIGQNAYVRELDGGNDTDTLYTETTGLNEKDFESSNVVCFVSGTSIATRAGPVPVEQLAVGQLVRTADHGDQPLRWIGSQTLDASTLQQHERLRPIRISAGALGGGFPARNLLVSPQHRILLRSAVAERMFGNAEILVPAKHLTQAPGISAARPACSVSYFHILFDRHEIVFADAAPAESFYLGPQVLGTLEAAALAEIERVLPGRTAASGQMATARFCPKGGRKVRWLVERHVRNGKDLVMPEFETDHRAAS